MGGRRSSNEGRREDRGRVRGWAAALCALAVIGASGCARDPLDPRGTLRHRMVPTFEEAAERARSLEAFERAQRRMGRVERGMSVTDVETAMEALVVAEGDGQAPDDPDPQTPRRKIIEGLLCTVDPSEVRRRWLFGYDDGGVVLVGFAIEFEREDPEDDEWVVRRVEQRARDGCPEG